MASPDYSPHSLSYTGANGISTNVYARWALPHCFYWTIVDKEKERLPLLSRGWAYQERLLAPRVANFTANELVWECICNTVCECSSRSHTSQQIIKCPKGSFRSSADWWRYIERYSELALTNESHRLPAISGIAKIVQDSTSGTYLAGLWSGHLPINLGWRRDVMTQKTPSEWRAPSWSWASVEGKVSFDSLYDISDRLLDVLNFNCELLSDDKTGQVVSGHLTVSGALLTKADIVKSPYHCDPKTCFFDYLEGKQGSESSAQIWWMPLAASSKAYWPFVCMVLQETEKRVDRAIPNLEMKALNRYNEMGQGISHSCAMKRIGVWQTSYDTDKIHQIRSQVSKMPKTIVTII
jgi:hypothetical protein